MSARYCSGRVLALFIPLLFSGCISMSSLSPGIAIFDTQTGQKIKQIKDASLDVRGPWGMHDMEVLLPANSEAKTFHTVFTNADGWCVREFDASGTRVTTRTLPDTVMHGTRSQYALSPDLDMIAYCEDDSKSIMLYRTIDGTKQTMLPDAFANPFSVKWIEWADAESIIACITPFKEAPYQGCVVLAPVGPDKPRVLYENPKLSDASVSPDRTHLAAVLMYMFPKPSELMIVDLLSGASKLVAKFERAPGHIGSNLIWSPDGKTFAYDRDFGIETYSLDSGERRILREHHTKDEYLMLAMHYIDDHRIACSYVKEDSNQGRLEILDASTGETMVSKKLYRGGELQVFDNGKSIAVEGR